MYFKSPHSNSNIAVSLHKLPWEEGDAVTWSHDGHGRDAGAGLRCSVGGSHRAEHHGGGGAHHAEEWRVDWCTFFRHRESLRCDGASETKVEDRLTPNLLRVLFQISVG